MKHLLLAPFLLGFISPVFADLGEANLNSDETYKRDNPSEIVYEAWCGKVSKESKNECKVQFKEGRLKVNDSSGITSDQIINAKYEEVCKFGIFHSRKCLDTYSFEYDSKGSKKVALINYSNAKVNKIFLKDIEKWLGREIEKECIGRWSLCISSLPQDPASRAARAAERSNTIQGTRLLNESLQNMR